jgi:hypothetical protein
VKTPVLVWGLAGAALMVAGALGPWVTALGVSASGVGREGGWAVVGAAALGALLLVLTRANRGAGLFPLIGGLVGTAVALRERNHITLAVHGAGELAHSAVRIGWGLDLALAASLAFALAGAVWLAAVPSAEPRPPAS